MEGSSKKMISTDGIDSTISIAARDKLLDELAAKSAYSHKSVRSKHPKQHNRPRSTILRTLFRHLFPEDASALTQIMLKDLRPISMYPLTEFHDITALTKFNASSVQCSARNTPWISGTPQDSCLLSTVCGPLLTKQQPSPTTVHRQ